MTYSRTFPSEFTTQSHIFHWALLLVNLLLILLTQLYPHSPDVALNVACMTNGERSNNIGLCFWPIIDIWPRPNIGWPLSLTFDDPNHLIGWYPGERGRTLKERNQQKHSGQCPHTNKHKHTQTQTYTSIHKHTRVYIVYINRHIYINYSIEYIIVTPGLSMCVLFNIRVIGPTVICLHKLWWISDIIFIFI